MTDSSSFWIDSHAHLTMFEPDTVSEILQRAAEAGVRGVIVPATGPDDLHRTLALGDQFPENVRTAVGLHPHDAVRLDPSFRKELTDAVHRPGVIAIGEIGLDYHYMNSPREDQIRTLEWQLDLALEADLPVILHNRESWDDLITILGERAGNLRGVCHSFTESPQRVAEVLELGLYVGVSGMVTFRRAENIREMASSIDLDRLLVETDSPFLTPEPHRGRPNEPAFTALVGTAIARLFEHESDVVARRTTVNVERLFDAGFSRRSAGADLVSS